MQRRILKTPQDITSLDGFVDKVDPSNTPLSHIVQSYYIHPHEIKCSLTGCGTIHKDGYIVMLTNKSVTNIGHVCGKRFGQRYEHALLKYFESINRPALLQTVTEGLSKVGAQQLELHSMQLRCRELRKLLSAFESLFPDTYTALRRRAYNNTSQVHESENRSKAEIDDLLAINPYQPREKVAIKEVLRGEIRGYKFPIVDWNSENGTFSVLSRVDKFLELNPQHLPGTKHLVGWGIWLQSFDDSIRQVKTAIEDGNQFFTEQNFRMFEYLSASPVTKAKLQNLKLRDLQMYGVPETSIEKRKDLPKGWVRERLTR